MNITVWEMKTNYFEIEITYFMTDTSHKYVVNDNFFNIQIQKGVLFIIAVGAFQ